MSDTQNDDDAAHSGGGPRQIETFDQLEEKLFKDGDYRIRNYSDTIVFRLHSTEPKAQGSGEVDAVISMTLTNRFATLSTLLTRDIFDAEGSVGGGGRDSPTTASEYL